MPRYIKLSETKSTNTYLAKMASTLPAHTVIYTYRQTAGRGQKGNSWESEDDKNLSFSYLLKAPAIEPSRQFFISEAVSLAVVDMLSQYVPDGISIKWPNDIYYRDQKICGILIEHTLSGSSIGHSIIGVGININQERFVSDAPNPVSLKNITGDDYDLERLLREVNERIERLTDFSESDEDALKALHQRYLSCLYRADGKSHQWQLPTGEYFEGVIVDVHPDGLLSIRHDSTGEVGKYYFKEVKHVINKHVL
ncbi:MAG: biotin--[acetyl-CoA-carboxylase] ligase [Bacteroidales bacterium]|nr:biotin--[acetyl-CoA-carboxylase] ligase [Bacteroidales bacterium]